jgi:hypothetical protein
MSGKNTVYRANCGKIFHRIRHVIQRKVDENREFRPQELRSRFVPRIRRESDIIFHFEEVEQVMILPDAMQSIQLESSDHKHKKKKMTKTHEIITRNLQEDTNDATIEERILESSSRIVLRKRKR